MSIPSPNDPVLAWVVSGADDRWRLHMACISTASTVVHHPAARRLWLTPRHEAAALQAALPAYLQGRVQVQPIATPSSDPLLSSRYIKVASRTLVDAERFVLLDTDMILVRPLPWNDWRALGVAASPNRDADAYFVPEPNNLYAQALFASAGWDWQPQADRPYLNTGLIVFGGDVQAYRFAAEWATCWNEFRAASGKHYDQPAFNRAAARLDQVALLPEAYNAPVAILPQSAAGATVFHYYSSGGEYWRLPFTLMGKFVVQSATTGRLNFRKFHRALRRGKPFVALGATPLEHQLAGQSGLEALRRLDLFLRPIGDSPDNWLSAYGRKWVGRVAKWQHSVSKRYRRWLAR